MGVKVAINGLGRIGRLVLRGLAQHKEIQLVAVNDLIEVDNLAYLLKYDSTHGHFPLKIQAQGDSILIGEHLQIPVFSEKDPTKLPWKRLGVDIVIESTGLFTSEEGAKKHLEAGAGQVLISAPAKGDLPTFVMGVNHEQYVPGKHRVISNASCTTNCLAPITKVLLENFGIEEGLMTTIHAMTASQATVDGPCKKDFRAGRSAFQNIIPFSTGAAKAVALCLPEVKGKLTGMSFRVPVGDVSAVDLTVRLTKATSYREICEKMKEASLGPLKGILHYCDDPVVSSDFISSHYSGIFDALAGIELNPHFFKLVAWYDNEMGYATRLVDLISYMINKQQGA